MTQITSDIKPGDTIDTTADVKQPLTPQTERIMRYNASLTPEQRSAAARRAGLRSAEVKREKKAKLETLIAASQDYLKEHSDEIIRCIVEIAEDCKSPSLQIKAATLLADISGQKAATEVKIGNNGKPFATLDLTSMTDDELHRLANIPDDDILIVDEAD